MIARIHGSRGWTASIATELIGLVCLITIVLLAASDADAQGSQGAVVLFRDHSAKEVGAAVAARAIPPALATQKGVLRSRAVLITTESLTELDLQPGARIVLDLFSDRAFVGVIEGIDHRGRGKYSWHGRIEGQPESSFDIVVEESVMVGNINPARGLPLEIRYGGDAAGHVIREVGPDDTISCGVGPEHNLRATATGSSESAEAPSAAAPEPAPDGSPPVAADSGAFIDVLIVYTTGARTAAGGENAINAIVQLTVDTTNTAYSTSGVIQRIRLAGRRVTGYSETVNTLNFHLNAVTNNGDGIMDVVHVWRNDYQADLVALIVNDTDGGLTFGTAWLIGGASQQAFGFSVTDQAFAGSAQNWSVAHELGHNMGSQHDQAEGGSDGITTWAFGHSFIGNTMGLLRTIMARRALGGTRIQRFSNPSLNFDGQPMGVLIGQPNEADNRTAFAFSAGNVANYRSELPADVWVQFGALGPFFLGTQTFPYNNMVNAEDQILWNGTVHIKSSTASDGSIGQLGADKAYRIATENGSSILD